jgi:hypothetical protein
VREKYCWLVADKPSEQGDGSRPLRRSLSWTPLSRAPAAACRGRAAPHWTPRAPRWAAVVGCSRAWLSAYGRRLTGRIGQQLTDERRVRSGKRSFEQGRGRGAVAIWRKRPSPAPDSRRRSYSPSPQAEGTRRCTVVLHCCGLVGKNA